MTCEGFFDVPVKAADDPNKDFSYSNAPSGLSPSQAVGTNGVLIGPSTHYQYVTTDGSSNVSGSSIAGNMFSSLDENSTAGMIGLWETGKPEGSYWSNPKYRIDVTKPQTIQFWVATSGGTGVYLDGGISFVIQNDSRGVQAIASDNKGITGSKTTYTSPNETMGVWAPDANLSHVGGDPTTGGPIQNSWALSFDYYPDSLGVQNRSFNDGVFTTNSNKGKTFIYSGYPDEANSYKNIGSNTFEMVADANGQTSGDVRDFGNDSENNGHWHHVTIKYNPPADGSKIAHVTYLINDILQNGTDNTINVNNGIPDSYINPKFLTKTVPLDLNKLHLTQNMVNWGFVGRSAYAKTAATNYKSSLILQATSTAVYAKAKAKIIDVTQNNRVLSDKNDYVNSGDALIYRYNLDYDSGNVDWTNVNSFVHIPSVLGLDSTRIGSISYSDGSPSDSLLNSTVKTDSDDISKIIQFKLKQNITKTNNAQEDIYVTAPTVTSAGDTLIDSKKSTFNNSMLTTTTVSPSFYVRSIQKKSLNLTTTDPVDPAKIAVTKGGRVTLNANASYGDKTAFTSPGLIMNLTVNGTAKDAIEVPVKTTGDKSIDISDAISKELTTEMNDGTLKSGSNSVSVYVADSYGNKSTTLKFNLNVIDQSATLNLSSDEYSFNDIQSYYRGLVSRKGAWKVDVIAVNSPWKLMASATKLVDVNDSNNFFGGYLVYKNADNQPADMSSDQLIAESLDKQTATTNVANWSSNEGILLDSVNYNEGGTKYSGKINWILSDTP